ncbi:MAG: hypothetical protein HZY75_13280 [Nocardioidaceae bacterium]|nr:MAG: hypothetical protein HZY75_13280 [Nocardioidaceae bacterium]
MPLPPKQEKFGNQAASLAAFVNYPGAPKTFWLWNDDMYALEPITKPYPAFHLGPAAAYLANRNPNNTWVKAVKATAEWCGTMDLPLHEAHVPLLLDTTKLRDLLDTYPTDRPFAVGATYHQTRAGDIGVNAGNAKCSGGDSLTEKLSLPMPYLSGNPESWAGTLGSYVKQLFPEPSRWER